MKPWHPHEQRIIVSTLSSCSMEFRDDIDEFKEQSFRLSVRARKVLRQLGLTSPRLVPGVSWDDVWQAKNCGAATIFELRAFFDKVGVSPTGDPTNPIGRRRP